MKNILIQMCQKTELPKMLLIPLRSGKERAKHKMYYNNTNTYPSPFFCLVISIKYFIFLFSLGFSIATKAPRDLELTSTYDA